jgi:hypothetical protein
MAGGTVQYSDSAFGSEVILGPLPGALLLEEINMGLAPRQVPTECSMSSAKKQTAKAAFEIKKGTRQVMTLSEAEVEKYLDLQELLNGLEDGFRGIELGEIQSPPRTKLSVAGKGFSLAMPAVASGYANYGENRQRLRWQCGYRSAESSSAD